MQVRLIAKTNGAVGTEYEGKSIDEIIVGTARVSSSREVNDLFTDPAKLIRYCMTEGHWSVLSQANLNIEITTSRAVLRQIMRHGFKPQEFSQRYAVTTQFEEVELRIQDKKNRQASGEVHPNKELNGMLATHQQFTQELYEHLIKQGVSKETARMILPECATSVACLQGDIRTWVSFLSQRLHKSTQKETRLVAEEVRDIFLQELPIVSQALFNFENAYEISVFDRLVLEKHVKKGNVAWRI